MLDELKLKLCDIQGRLFVLSASKDYDSKVFVSGFMKSDVAKALDSEYNRMQWAGEEYLLEEMEETSGLSKGDSSDDRVLYWIGYLYRFWQFHTGESSAKIYKQASFDTMTRNYMMFHTMDPVLAVEKLKEIYKQKR